MGEPASQSPRSLARDEKMGEKEASSSIEMTSLLGTEAKGTVNIVGSEFTKNGAPWHVVLAFNYPTKESAPKFAEKMEKPVETWQKIFTGHNKTGQMPPSVKEGMTKKQFSSAAFDEIVSIMGGKHNGLQLDTMYSIDNDELFLTMALIDPTVKANLADAEEFKVMLSEDTYMSVKEQMPTDHKTFQENKGHFEVEKDGEGFAANAYPAYLQFRSSRANKYQELGELDCMRLVRRRIGRFFHVDELIEAGVIIKMFPVHHWDSGVEMLYKKGWNDLTKIFQWPSEDKSDLPNKYFGPEIGFFFHWFGMMTRYLMIPAGLSLITFSLRMIHQYGGPVDRVTLNYSTMAFALILTVWASVFIGRYRQMKNLKQVKWGMEHLGEEALVVRKEFVDAYRDSFKDNLQHVFHWTMVIFMVWETLAVVSWTSAIQVNAAKNPDGTTWGISNELVVVYPKYIITINIKLVDKVWTPISNMLSKKENWRSVQELQENMVIKMFIVKMFVFYYPFVYEIVIKPMTVGCGENHSHTDLTGCVDSMNTNLMLFFITQVCTEVALILVGLGMTAWSVRSEKKLHPNKEYTYLELQAKTAPYSEDTLIADYLNAVVTYGYIVLFGVSLPFMCFLGMVSNMVMIRLAAFKMSYAFQRPMPKAMDGIGAWEAVMKNLGYLGVPANAYIAIFTLSAFKDHSMEWKLLAFIIVQNVGMALKVGIEGLIQMKSTAQMRISEYTADKLDILLEEPDPTNITEKPTTVKAPTWEEYHSRQSTFQ